MEKPKTQPLTSPESEMVDNFSSVDWEAIRHTLAETSDLIDTDDRIEDNRNIILQRRAEQMSQMPQNRVDADDKLPILTFKLGTEKYALPVTAIRSISELHDITPIPCVPDYYRGITNLKGKLVSVLDLMVFLGVDEDRNVEAMSHPPKKMMIVAIGADLEIGLMVEQVGSVTEISRETLMNVQSLGYDVLHSVSAITSDGLILLDIEQLFRDPRIRIYEEAG
jgi:purine-binding chemotaxis protein CheW